MTKRSYPPEEAPLREAPKTWPRERPKGTRMGRGHYKLTAAVLRGARPVLDDKHHAQHRARWEFLCSQFAEALSTTNPSFRRETFLAACGVDE